MECIVCGSEFEPKRKTAKYCSAKCRKLAFQDVIQEQQNAKDKNANSENGNAKQNANLCSCFEDLPEDVQGHINELTPPGDKDRADRIQRAVEYQRIFPYCNDKIDDRLVCCGPCA